MIRNLFLFVLLCLPFGSFAQQEAKTNIILLDITESMKGYNPSTRSYYTDENIWPKVKSYLNKSLENNFNEGDSLYLYTFGWELKEEGAFKISSSNTSDIQNVLNDIETQIVYTCIYKSLESVFKRHLSRSSSRACQVYLYTDGKDSGTSDCDTDLFASEIVNFWRSKKSENDFLYYFCFGQTEAPEEIKTAALDKENHIETDAVDLEKIDLILEPRIRDFIFDLG